MKANLNPDYIIYKVLFTTSAYNQKISKNLDKLLIKGNAQTYFPEFIFYRDYYDHICPSEVHIKIKGIDDIVHKILYKLIHNKCNEIKF